jgi:hypothetical protein
MDISVIIIIIIIIPVAKPEAYPKKPKCYVVTVTLALFVLLSVYLSFERTAAEDPLVKHACAFVRFIT